MKRILLLLLIFLVSFSPKYYSTTWAGTASNQGITQTAIKDAVTTAALYQTPVYTIPPSLRCITKADAATYHLDSYYGVSLKGTNDLLVKEDFRVCRVDVTEGQTECDVHTSSYTLTVYLDAEYMYATHIYTDKKLTTSYVGSGAWITITDGFWTYQVKVNSSGVITQISAC
jgi:hypothetical protein